MSSEIFLKSVDVVSWQQEMAYISSLSTRDLIEDAFFMILFSDDNRPVRIVYQGDAIMNLDSFDAIKNSIPKEVREKAELFLDAFPPRISGPETPLLGGCQKCCVNGPKE